MKSKQQQRIDRNRNEKKKLNQNQRNKIHTQTHPQSTSIQNTWAKVIKYIVWNKYTFYHLIRIWCHGIE